MPSAVIAAYDYVSQTLSIRYHSGKVYHYLGVPEKCSGKCARPWSKEFGSTAISKAGEYAALLNRSAPVLNRTVKIHFNKTLSQLVADRIVVEAKRQLYLTAKPVKLVAFKLGFNDEFYFSRYFKSKVTVSSQRFRDTVGVDRAEG